jgi:hypothetical protein
MALLETKDKTVNSLGFRHFLLNPGIATNSSSHSGFGFRSVGRLYTTIEIPRVLHFNAVQLPRCILSPKIPWHHRLGLLYILKASPRVAALRPWTSPRAISCAAGIDET